MLVLSRKANEEILIGDNIKITLVRIKGGSVRIGIDAPREVRVVRGELQGDLKDRRSVKVSRDDQRQTVDSDAIDGLAEVFAYPQDQRFAGRASATGTVRTSANTSRVGCHQVERSDAIKAAAMAAGVQSDLPVDKVSPNGDSAKLRRAPLAGYVAAS